VPAARSAAGPYATPPIALEQLPPADRAAVAAIVEKPTLRTRGPVEVFNCQPSEYYWLLDNPDIAVLLWRALGARCTDILRDADDGFGWRDEQGNRLAWRAVLRSPTQRIWYAEGQGKPGLLLPMIAVRAVVVLHHQEGVDRSGKSAVRHQAELIVQTDSHAVALAAKVLGASAPHLAEQYAAQIETFFGALAWYLHQEPDQGRQLLTDAITARQEARSPTASPRPIRSRASPVPLPGSRQRP
jgi:hypothetical protein